MSRANWGWAVVGGIIYAMSWHLMEQGIEWLFASSPARAAYGTMSAWWFVLYVSYVLELNWQSLPSALIVFFGLEAIFQPPKSMIGGLSVDLAPTYVIMIIGMSVFFLSPFVVSVSTNFIKTRLWRHPGIGT